MSDDVRPLIGNHEKLTEFFGCWPSFHDAEVLSLELNRSGQSRLRVYTFKATPPLENQSAYTLTKHVVVTFVMEGISELQLDGFSGQNVISSLVVSRTPEGRYCLRLGECYGLSGTLVADQMRLEFEPGP